MKVLMIGATGSFAGLVLPELKRAGVAVRALVKDQKGEQSARERGADETALGDLADVPSLTAAAQGVDAVFFILPAAVPDESRMGTNMVEAAKAARVKKIVFSGVIHPSLGQLPNHAAKLPVEQAIYTSGLTYVVLQPAMFMQNTEAAWPQIVQSRKFVLPYSTETKFCYVDYRDVAEVAAIALTTDRLDNGTFELSAPGMHSRTELAGLMSEALGTKIEAVAVPFDAFAQQVGLPEGHLREKLRIMFAEYDARGFSGGNGLVLEAILGREPRSLQGYFTELAARASQGA